LKNDFPQSRTNESIRFEVRLMLHSPVRRGRPKGTGIDDSVRIARLVELLRIQPDLRPTTAIRLMGYSDPSAIRRLRDKYKVFALSTRVVLMKDFVANGASPGACPAEPKPSASQSPQLR
jgi:hypothetical protein